jgi:ribonucleoside-diphosphate reductase alpha chain
MGELSLSENALRVLQARYLRRDENKRVVETPEELFDRVAAAVSEAEANWGGRQKAAAWRDEFRRMLLAFEFLPNSPTLMNAGTELGQLSACFVLPVEDTMEGIFDAVKQMALVQRTGGGTGFSFARLRPKGAVVESTGGEASGPVSFMKIFDAATEHIKQGGRRRGANMGILRVDHPDIMEFVTAKLDGRTLQNFNISVGATDEFLQAAREGRNYKLRDPATEKVAGELNAKEVFDAIVQAAWQTGDPGLIFLDTINRTNPTPYLGPIEATNPCGEIPLLPYEACNLASINLPKMLREKEGKVAVDWDKLKETVRKVVRFLDDVIEVNRYPIPEIGRIARANRKIGLGVMGFAEMLIRLGISYDSSEAVRTGEELMKVIFEEAQASSRALAEERGLFANWKGSVYEKKNLKLRNATLTAIAPTGTISIIAGTSASIEPLFALAYRRHALERETLFDVNSVFLRALEGHGLGRKEILEEIFARGSLKMVRGIPETLKSLFVTALEVPVDRHLAIQAAFQRHVDNSVSKTINMPHESMHEDVARAYWKAWELGLKGITIYRYGSKSSQVLELGVDEDALRYEYSPRCDPGECKI